jgi:hypothetical protein
MKGRQNNDQGPLFYEFRLDEAVPADHLTRATEWQRGMAERVMPARLTTASNSASGSTSAMSLLRTATFSVTA